MRFPSTSTVHSNLMVCRSIGNRWRPTSSRPCKQPQVGVRQDQRSRLGGQASVASPPLCSSRRPSTLPWLSEPTSCMTMWSCPPGFDQACCWCAAALFILASLRIARQAVDECLCLVWSCPPGFDQACYWCAAAPFILSPVCIARLAVDKCPESCGAVLLSSIKLAVGALLPSLSCHASQIAVRL